MFQNVDMGYYTKDLERLKPDFFNFILASNRLICFNNLDDNVCLDAFGGVKESKQF